ncbi:MAG TPA: M20/M25/M40 family metallo-hydrolase [Acidimicrobiales bacterium]|nr:M20/M25/M40 family metallo-hydrolase [Acidimicrobiales bacterium]
MSEVVELLQQLIRNACVSRGWPSTGEESRNAGTLRSVLGSAGLDVEWVEPVEGRASLLARIEGSDPDAPSLCLMGHTDVVPADPAGWTHDPFGGELVDGEVWGRGAVDMLNQTAAMALAVRRLADAGFRPRGTLVFAAVPDEECGGAVGAGHLAEHHADAFLTDYAVTEVGGAVADGPDGPIIEAYVAEKGGAGFDVKVRGRQAHSSSPWGVDNAVVIAAEVVRRLQQLRPRTQISDTWRGWVRAQGFDAEREALLLDPERLWDALPSLPPALAARAHACTHSLVVPTIVRGGDKINTIPGRATVSVNVRVAPGDTPEAVIDEVEEALADLGDKVAVERHNMIGPTQSPTGTPLWDAMTTVARAHHPGAALVPSLLVGGTDGRWLRPKGVVTYGFGVLSRKVTPREYWTRFHGADERIDVESLAMSTAAWEDLARTFVG